jgi:hypothetical protein
MEVTRVNCGGVSAHLTDGYVVRSMQANPASQLVAVSLLEGNELGLRIKAIQRIRKGEEFEREKDRLGVPKGLAKLEWVLHIVAEQMNDRLVEAVVQTLAEAVGVGVNSREVMNFKEYVKGKGGIAGGHKPKRGDTIENLESILPPPNDLEGLKTTSTVSSSHPQLKKDIHGSIPKATEKVSHSNEKQENSPSFWDFTFMNTFDAVSEFTTSSPVSHTSATATGLVSFLGIVTVHVLALWQNDWIVSIGWILVITGYFGIVFGVMLAALIINSSCVCIQLNDDPPKNKKGESQEGQWQDGMVVSVKNPDSMDTTGSTFVSSSVTNQRLEAVYIKSLSQNDRLIASGITVSLASAFIVHYLGLRAIKWWASIGELGICIGAAFARSVSNDMQPRFEEVDGLKIDKRCISTGVIRVQTSRLVDEPRKGLDARAYSPRELESTPTVGERVAFQTARLCLGDDQVRRLVTKLTGMHVQITNEGQGPLQRAVLVTCTGGILFKEGLGFPSARLITSFRASCSSLAAPTPFLARAIMRQPAWTLTAGAATDIPLGNVYVFAMQSMLDWWTLSEDRNGMGDLQKNLHWPMFLINAGFYLEVFSIGKVDEEMLGQVSGKHEPSGEEDMKAAKEIGTYLRRWATQDSV